MDVLGADSDVGLIQRARRGDQAAFDELYQKYERPLFQFIQRYLKNAEEAEEVFQEVFMKVLNHKSVEFIDESARGWLYVTARNMSLNRIRKRTRTAKVKGQLAYMDDLATYQFEDEKIQEDLMERIQQRSQKLSPEQQSMLEMRLAGLSNKEIADLQNIPEGTVKSRFHAIVQYFKKGFSQ